MKNFQQYQPTKIHFGSGCINQIGSIAANHGKTCLLVTYSNSMLADSQKKQCERLSNLLKESGIHVKNFFGAVPNPSTDCVNDGVKEAKKSNVDFIIAFGGGSVIDTSKMIAFLVKNSSITWDKLFSEYSDPFPTSEPNCQIPLPLIAISTTSGTGSQVTQAAIITNLETKQKTSVFHSLLYPKECMVDPELMISVPSKVTADTGFDAFSHAFESYINKRATPFSEILSLEAMRIIFSWLPKAVKDGQDLLAREQMAFADTLAGKSLSMAGATLPHPLGEEIGSTFPQVPHGRSMAVIYPEFMRFASISATEKFANIGRLLDSRLKNVPDKIASIKACNAFENFLKKIGMWISFEDLGISHQEIEHIPQKLAPIGMRMSPRAAEEEDLRKIIKGALKR